MAVKNHPRVRKAMIDHTKGGVRLSTSFGDSDVGVSEHKLSNIGIKGESMQARVHGEAHHGSRRVNGVTSGHKSFPSLHYIDSSFLSKRKMIGFSKPIVDAEHGASGSKLIKVL